MKITITMPQEEETILMRLRVRNSLKARRRCYRKTIGTWAGLIQKWCLMGRSSKLPQALKLKWAVNSKICLVRSVKKASAMHNSDGHVLDWLRVTYNEMTSKSKIKIIVWVKNPRAVCSLNGNIDRVEWAHGGQLGFVNPNLDRPCVRGLLHLCSRSIIVTYHLYNTNSNHHSMQREIILPHSDPASQIIAYWITS